MTGLLPRQAGGPRKLRRFLEVQANADPGPIRELNPAALQCTQDFGESGPLGQRMVCLKSFHSLLADPRVYG
jgi:hypothetical protein